MTSGAKDPWEVLRRAYTPAACAARAAGHTLGAGVNPAPEDDPTTQHDLAVERAAIMEYDGGLRRADAEALSTALLGPFGATEEGLRRVRVILQSAVPVTLPPEMTKDRDGSQVG